MGLFDKLFGKKEETFDPNHIFAPMAGQTVPVAEVPILLLPRVFWVKVSQSFPMTVKYMPLVMLPLIPCLILATPLVW